MKIKLVFFMVLSFLNTQSVLVAKDEKVQPQRVDQESLYSAMDTVSKSAYDPKATTNGIRYQTDVIIYLLENGARQDLEQSEKAPPLLIGYKDWYEAFKRVNCQNQKVPEYVKEANNAKQNIVIDYDRRKVITKIYRGGNPDLVANIKLYWPPEFGESFSYIDDLSIPPLRVINESVITYRLLKYKDDNLIVCDQIKGLKGKALSGFLRFLGKAYMTQYRIVPVKDGPQYVRMVTKKWIFTWKNNLTIEPDGETLDGVLNKKVKQTLHRKIRIQYEPLEKS